MASESVSDSHRDYITTETSSIAPPRLPPPAGLQLPHYQNSESRPWSSSSSQFPHSQTSPGVPGLAAEVSEHRAAVSRHLLPLLVTSQTSHRLLRSDQLPSNDSGQHSKKRRRVEESQGSVSPNLVSRSNLSADSS